MTRVSHALDRIDATFDDPNLVANAGLLLVATLSQRLGLEALIDQSVRLEGVGGARAGRKVLTVVHTMCAGGSHIDHTDMLRAGLTAGVLGHRVMAPSTIGTFLRSFTFGHCRQIEAVNGYALERVWAAGVGPAGKALVIDIDSTSARSTARPSTVPATATRTISATTRSLRREPTPVRCCTPGCAKDKRTPSAGSAGSSTN